MPLIATNTYKCDSSRFCAVCKQPCAELTIFIRVYTKIQTIIKIINLVVDKSISYVLLLKIFAKTGNRLRDMWAMMREAS